MQTPLVYGFLIPPRGKAIPLSEHLTHYDYCQKYIKDNLTNMQKEAFEQFCCTFWEPSPLRQNTPDTDFCIQVLDWCQVGTNSPKKVITFTGTADWHEKIYIEYKSYGFKFNFIPKIELSTLVNPI